VRLSAKGSHVWKGKRKGCQGLYVDAERERERGVGVVHRAVARNGRGPSHDNTAWRTCGQRRAATCAGGAEL
jgi:hypothetical protein